MGQALRWINGGQELWKEWSQTSDKFNGDDDLKKWETFLGDRSGYKVVFARAQDYGWVNTGTAYDTVQIFSKHAASHPKEAHDLEWQDVSIVDLFTNPPQPPQFLIAEILPAHLLTLLSAHGGAGKSQLALQAAVCLAMGLPFMGKATTQCHVLFYSAEDSQNILRHRLANICKVWQLDPLIVDKTLKIIDATQDPCLYLEGTARRADTTPGYTKLKTRLSVFDVAIIDNASDTFDGNENDRGQVRGFIRALMLLKVTVWLLAHIAKQTARKQEENQEAYTGSTAWHNSPRSRLFLTREGTILTLTHQKSNHGQLSDPICMSWPKDGVLTHMPKGKPTAADDPATSDALISLIAECNRRKDYLSSKRGNVPSENFKRLSVMPGFPTATITTKEQLTAHLDHLLTSGRLTIQEYKDGNRNTRQRYEVIVNPSGSLSA
jgi:hypothetical protein